MKRILVIGASSAIAEHCIRIWAQRGDALFLIARNDERLNAIVNDARVRGGSQVGYYCMDLNEIDHHTRLLEFAITSLGHIDIAMIAHGTLSRQKECERSAQQTLAEIKTNALSSISLLTHLANYFETRRSGVIALISSVAGDRGKASNYVYGSAKAMITVFTSGLRQRLHASNVKITTIKLGFVDTPMTSEFKKGLLWAKPVKVAVTIVNAIDLKKDEVYVPAFWSILMLIIKAIPMPIFKRIKL